MRMITCKQNSMRTTFSAACALSEPADLHKKSPPSSRIRLFTFGDQITNKDRISQIRIGELGSLTRAKMNLKLARLTIKNPALSVRGWTLNLLLESAHSIFS